MDAAARVLGHMGKKLKTHEIHVRRSENGYIAKHLMRDKDGNSPTDGQRGEKEFNIDNVAQLASHMAEHMPDKQEPDEDDQAQAAPQPGPSAPITPPQPGQ